MANIDALMSPTGGYGYENNINSGMSGILLGFTMDKSVHRWLIAKPAMASFNSNHRYGNARSIINQRLATIPQVNITERMRLTPKIMGPKLERYTTDMFGVPYNQSKLGKGFGILSKDYSVPRPTDHQYAKAAFGTIYRNPKDFASAISARKQTVKNIFATRRAFQAVGWTMAASWAFELAQSAFTPGISKVAARSEQQMIQPLDSQYSFTMRQRAVQAIHDSLMTTRQVIGQEAQFMHR